MDKNNCADVDYFIYCQILFLDRSTFSKIMIEIESFDKNLAKPLYTILGYPVVISLATSTPGTIG